MKKRDESKHTADKIHVARHCLCELVGFDCYPLAHLNDEGGHLERFVFSGGSLIFEFAIAVLFF